MGKRARIHGSTLRARSLEDKAAAARAVERHVVPLLAAGSVRVPVQSTFAMSDAAGAYEAFAAGGKPGKLVLPALGRPDPSPTSGWPSFPRHGLPPPPPAPRPA